MLEFFYSPGSRYSYLALTQVPELEREFGVEFEWIPNVGGRVRALRGADPFRGPPQSGQYDWEYRRKDAEAWADYYGVAFHEPRSVEFDADLLTRAAVAAARLDCARDYAVELAAEIFARKGWPIDEALCHRVAAALGLDVSVFAKWVAAPEIAEEVEANCQRAFASGLFGNPTFVVDDAMIWGQDRLVLVRHALERRRR